MAAVAHNRGNTFLKIIEIYTIIVITVTVVVSLVTLINSLRICIMMMKLSYSNGDIMEISHLGKTLSWDISNFSRTKMVKDEEQFRETNAFFNSLPEHTQQNIFDTYTEMKAVFEVAIDFVEMQTSLTRLTTELYGHVQLDEIRHYLKYHANVIYPKTLKTDYDDSDTNKSRTYLKHEYEGLVLLVLATRFMIPVWGEYLTLNLKRLSGFKEYQALKLLSRTELIKSPEMGRLRIYVETTGISKNDKDNAIIRGTSSEELSEYILAIIVVRELSIGSIDASKEGTRSIITNIFGRIKNAVRDISRRPSQIREKFKLDDVEGEDKSSRLEQYKNVQPVSIGDIEIHKYFVNRGQELALKVDPTLDLSKLSVCMTLTKRMGTFNSDKHNILLVQWVLSRKVPARVIPELTASELLTAMAVTQALLWHWGFLDLALLVTSTLDKNRQPMVSSSRKQAKKETTKLLNELFPYQANTASKSNSKNGAHRAADELEKSVRSHFLLTKAPAGLKTYLDEITVNGSWVCPNDLLTQLTDMIVYVHKDLKEAEIQRESITTTDASSL